LIEVEALCEFRFYSRRVKKVSLLASQFDALDASLVIANSQLCNWTSDLGCTAILNHRSDGVQDHKGIGVIFE